MSRMLFMARGGGLMFSFLSGRSILADLPFDVHVLVDKRSAVHFEDAGDNVIVEIVRWSDWQAIKQRVDELYQQEPLFAILTLNEQLMEMAAELREALGISGAGSDQVKRFRDKVEMKRCLSASFSDASSGSSRESPLRVPQYAECTDRKAVNTLLDHFGKIVIKPRNSTGSKGVAMINDHEALDAWFEKATSPADFEAEEYIAGDLYHINALVLDGEVKVSATAIYIPGKSTLEFTDGEPLETVMLSDGELKNRMEQASDTVIQALGLCQGITHLECFLTPDDEVVFCEIAARPAGGGVIWMIERQYGVNFSRAAVLIEADRGKVALQDACERSGVVGLVAFRPGSSMGTVKQVPQAADLLEEWVHLAKVYIQPGSTALPSSHSTDYLGVCVLSAADQADFIDKCQQLNKRFYQQCVIDFF